MKYIWDAVEHISMCYRS